MQDNKPVRGKRKAPEPAEEDESEDDDVSSEDDPLPGEEDPDDSNESDEDVLEHDDAEEPADELAAGSKLDKDANSRRGASSKQDSRTAASTAQNVRAQQALDATDDTEIDSDEDLGGGMPTTSLHLALFKYEGWEKSSKRFIMEISVHKTLWEQDHQA